MISAGGSDEREELGRTLRRFLERLSSSQENSRLLGTDLIYDNATWQRMASQLGLQGLTVPERHGGSGAGLAEQVVVMEEIGYALACLPYLSTVLLAAGAVVESGDTAAGAEILRGINDGLIVATLAWVDPDGGWGESPGGTVAVQRDGQYLLTGRKTLVLDAGPSNLILVSAGTTEGLSLFAVSSEASGLALRNDRRLDRGGRLSDLELDSAPGRLIGSPGSGEAVLRRTIRNAAIGLVAEQLGVARRCLEICASYCRSRQQYGQPIAQFQSVRHRLAHMTLLVQSMRVALDEAVSSAQGDGAPVLAVLLAKSYCSTSLVRIAEDGIQLHGGVGLLAHHDCQLIHRWAKWSERFLGAPTEQQSSVANSLLSTPT